MPAAEPAEDVAAYLVPRIRRVPQEPSVSPVTGDLQPTYIQFLTRQKALGKIAGRVLTGANKNRYVQES